MVAKVFRLTVYFYASSITLMLLSHGFWYAVESSSLSSAFYHLYQYLKWYYENRNDLGYGISIRILVAFFTPHLLYKFLLSLNLKSFLANKIMQFVRKRKGGESSNSSPKVYFTNNGYGGKVQSAQQKVDLIKHLLMKDMTQIIGSGPQLIQIDRAIENRLYAIFFGKSDKPH
ncbi:hypothetical protein [Wolbachia endosymbiont of Ctenocephalides felis wCfeT]|uniref:hypothetical protein n=1 Tax=Wolbachia endosymbiont of Ctenocephalides felis wCfeT TaxID=2732593 RepID=UPI001FECA746|nr:hypothetical protein [Wolbachia endosymbiont of Ctenocephalides felis wCfeT]